MPDPFAMQALPTNGPAIGAMALSPSDSTDLPQAIRGVTIGGAGGTLSFISSRDGQTYTTAILPAGTYALTARRVLATGTTATGLTGWI